MAESTGPQPTGETPGPSTSSIKSVLITVFGTVLVALITTFGAIYTSGSKIKETSDLASQTSVQVNKLSEDAAGKLGLIPVGSIVPSLLEPAAFAKEAGDQPTFDLTKSRWTLADGKPVPGTRYAELTGNAPVPDLRGIFLRGKNNGRADGRQNPQELNLGQYQDDQFQDHIHEYNRGGNTPNGQELYALPANTNGNIQRAPTNYIITGKHGDETRPRNVTVNYYIRIN